jgi:hypothetical protein
VVASRPCISKGGWGRGGERENAAGMGNLRFFRERVCAVGGKEWEVRAL